MEGGGAPSGGSLVSDGGFVPGFTLSRQLFFLVTPSNPEFFFFKLENFPFLRN